MKYNESAIREDDSDTFVEEPPVTDSTNDDEANTQVLFPSDTVSTEDVVPDRVATDTFSASSSESECEDSLEVKESGSRVGNSSRSDIVDESCPNQPKLTSYNPQVYGKFSRDFKFEWFEKHPWLS